MPHSGYEAGLPEAEQAEQLAKIVTEAVAKLPGAAESYIRTQLNRVVEDFFRRSTAWRVLTGADTITTTDLPVCLNPYSGTARVIFVLDCFIDGYPIHNFNLDSRVTLRTANTATKPTGFYTNPFDTVYFSPIPTQDVENVSFVLALKPIPENDVPEWIIDQFYEHLLNGVYARMYSEKDKPYTDRTMAEAYGRRYLSNIAEAKIIAEKNFSTGHHNWSFPRFAK